MEVMYGRPPPALIRNNDLPDPIYTNNSRFGDNDVYR